jgi:uncharacterized membrane protein required for colicin V production
MAIIIPIICGSFDTCLGFIIGFAIGTFLLALYIYLRG